LLGGVSFGGIESLQLVSSRHCKLSPNYHESLAFVRRFSNGTVF